MDDSLMFTHFNTLLGVPCLVHVYIVFNPNPSGKDDKGPLLHLHDLERRRNLLDCWPITVEDARQWHDSKGWCMEVWQISILKRFHWPIWHPFLKKSSQDSGNHQKERGERHFVLPMVSRCKKKLWRPGLSNEISQQDHQNKRAKLTLHLPNLPTCTALCTKNALASDIEGFPVVDWLGTLGTRETVPMVRQNLPISTVSQSMSKFKTKNCQQVMVQFFAERPSDLILISM